MSEAQEMKKAIQNLIQQMMDALMEKVLHTDPFLKDKHRTEKPLYAALIPDEIFKSAHLERRFVTPFGTMWEKLAQIAAFYGHGYSITQHTIHGSVKEERLRRIIEILNRLEHPAKGQSRIKPDWNAELAYILSGTGENIPVSVVCDLYVKDTHTGQRFAFELKAPLPNSDQCKVSKEKLFKLYAMNETVIDEAFFTLPYNPYGTKENYSWSFPNRWFNMQQDKVILIGDEFWEKIGGQGTYQTFIDAINEIGQIYKERIYREYLGIEPPSDTFTLS